MQPPTTRICPRHVTNGAGARPVHNGLGQSVVPYKTSWSNEKKELQQLLEWTSLCIICKRYTYPHKWLSLPPLFVSATIIMSPFPSLSLSPSLVNMRGAAGRRNGRSLLNNWIWLMQCFHMERSAKVGLKKPPLSSYGDKGSQLVAVRSKSRSLKVNVEFWPDTMSHRPSIVVKLSFYSWDYLEWYCSLWWCGCCVLTTKSWF